MSVVPFLALRNGVELPIDTPVEVTQLSRMPPRCDRLSAVSLLTELDAFYLDHRRCGELDADVDGTVVWFDCECGALMARRADGEPGPGGRGHSPSD